MKSKLLWSALITLIFASACSGLAGEPEVVATVPHQNNVQPVEQPVSEPPDEFNLELGAQIFAENCTRCHGISGAGDGELVQNGEITSIPNFTDPANIEGKTISDYFQVITNGNLASLMPPWAGSLSENERWAVAAYTYGMAGVEPVAVAQAPVTTEEAASDQTPAPATTEEAAASDSGSETGNISGETTGTISGAVSNGTVGEALPENLTVTLRMLDAMFNEETVQQPLNPDGTFSFADVVIQQDHGYVVSVEYKGIVFNSEMVLGDPQITEIPINLTVYETTTDSSVAKVTSALNQVDAVQGGIQVVQLISFENTSDRAFINAEGSVRVPLPQNAQLIPDANDLNRFRVLSDGRTVIDTRPLFPDQQHVIHLIYFVPQANVNNLRQELDYDITGPLEIYLGSETLELVGDGFITLGSQQAGTAVYRGYALNVTEANNKLIEYGLNVVAAPQTTVSSGSSTSSTDLLAYGLMAVGVGLLAIAGVLFWYLRDKDIKISPAAAPETSNEERIQILMHQIAELDNQHDAAQISPAQYERERNRLKAELKTLMQAAAGD